MYSLLLRGCVIWHSLGFCLIERPCGRCSAGDGFWKRQYSYSYYRPDKANYNSAELTLLPPQIVPGGVNYDRSRHGKAEAFILAGL